MSRDKIKKLDIVRYKNGISTPGNDVVLVERPLTLKVAGDPFLTLMCSQGDEIHLAAGLLFSEGIIDSKKDLAVIRFCPEEDNDTVEIKLAPSRRETASKRIEAARGISRSSCGICGKKLICDIVDFIEPVESALRVEAGELIELANSIGEKHQELFGLTGAAHSAAIVDEDLELLSAAEDVGRHNAMDKSIGKLVLDPPKNPPAIAIVSSRASLEMTQKAARAGLPVACFAGAVTNMAVELAEKTGVTLVGFLRHNRLNVYTHPQRLTT